MTESSITVHATNHQSFRQLSQKHVVLDQEKYSLNLVDLKIKLRRSRDVLALMAEVDNYKIIIKDLALFVRNVQL
jgi:hypothetical protein